MASPHLSYRESDIQTADRGKLILMVYDHCIKWVRTAEEELKAGNIERMCHAIQRAQKGIYNLMSSLNMEKGGDIARNLFRLYDFYSRHLSMALSNRSATALRDVAVMLARLREAWGLTIDKIRREERVLLAQRGKPITLVT